MNRQEFPNNLVDKLKIAKNSRQSPPYKKLSGILSGFYKIDELNP
jgi:hypothetical protein